MKYLPFIMLLLFGQTSTGQTVQDTTVSKRTLDSLRFELWQKARTINSMRWAYNLKVNTIKTDSALIKNDSLVVSYWSKEKKLIAQDLIKLAHSPTNPNCKAATVHRYFDENGRVVFIEYWDNYCYDSPSDDEEVKRFDAKLAREERLKYDSLGRLAFRFSYEYQSFKVGRTQKIIYSYDGNNKQTQRVEKINRYDFWN